MEHGRKVESDREADMQVERWKARVREKWEKVVAANIPDLGSF